MPTPSWFNANIHIQDAMPVKIDNPLSTTTAGITIVRSSITANPVMDRFSKDVIIDVTASAYMTYNTTGLGSSLPDGKYSTLFFLNFKGLVLDGQYVFPESVVESVGGASSWYFKGGRSDELIMNTVTNGSNATGDAYITLRYMMANVNFGYGVLFPQFT